MNIYTSLNLINYAVVLFFGITTSLCLADIPFRKHQKIYLFSYLGFGIVQIAFYLFLGKNMLYKCYPMLIHLPLIILIRFILHKSLSVSMIAVLSAYLLCTPRKWFGTLISSFFSNNAMAFNISAILITIPLLFLVIRYMAPYITKLKQENKTTLILFILLPLSYYVLEYMFTVYTDLLYTGGAVITDFMDSFLVFLYFILSILTIEFSSQRNQAEQEKIILIASASQAQKQLQQLSYSEKQSAIYRHDLRHHINFLQECIRENQLEQAVQYMNDISRGLDNITVRKYCKNEAINLILSSYVEQAKDQQISTTVTVTATDFSRFQIPDLCSLLANAMENAIHACAEMETPSTRYINLKIYEKNNLLCINMANSCKQNPVFKDNIPVSRKNGHGIGVHSIISVIEKYHGIYGFYVSHGEFRFQASL